MNPLLTRNWESLRSAVARLESTLPELEVCASLIVEALATDHKVLAAGNGGSACDAFHLCEELVGRYRQNRPAIAAVCLNADSTALTCIGNDYGFEKIFSRQIEALGQGGDVLVLFTTSGNSENLVQAAQAARSRGVKVVGFSGHQASRLTPYCDAQWVVEDQDGGARIQEMHTWATHVIIELIEERLFPALSFPSA